MTGDSLPQQAAAPFKRASAIFENMFLEDSFVCGFFNDYSEYLRSCYGDDAISPFPVSEAACHTSLGCFFDQATGQVSRFLKMVSTESCELSPGDSFSLYALLLDTLWQRMLDVYAVFGLSDRPNPLSRLDTSGDGLLGRLSAESFRTDNESLYQISRWADFFKHPQKSAWLLHQPQFLFAGSEELEKILAEETRFRLSIIDDEFIRNNYPIDAGGTRISSSGEFERKKVVIVLPDVAAMTEQICGCLVSFIEVIGPVYCRMLDNARSKAGGS